MSKYPLADELAAARHPLDDYDDDGVQIHAYIGTEAQKKIDVSRDEPASTGSSDSTMASKHSSSREGSDANRAAVAQPIV